MKARITFELTYLWFSVKCVVAASVAYILLVTLIVANLPVANAIPLLVAAVITRNWLMNRIDQRLVELAIVTTVGGVTTALLSYLLAGGMYQQLRNIREESLGLFGAENSSSSWAAFWIALCGLQIMLSVAHALGGYLFRRTTLKRMEVQARYLAASELLLASRRLAQVDSLILPESRKEIVDSIEFASNLIEVGLEKELEIHNADLRQRVGIIYSQISVAVEHYVIRVAAPANYVREQLKDLIGSDGLALMLGDDALLPRQTIASATVRDRTVSALKAIGIVLAGLVPLGVILVCRFLGLTLPAELATPVVFAAIVMAILSVITLIDPNVSNRIEAVRGVVEAVRGKSQ